ncbi:sugar transferase [Enterococcus faecium]|nr:sugar transferase [Enterococcus faecium]MCU2010728.1 sugar transferase [Enterococcus faecium]
MIRRTPVFAQDRVGRNGKLFKFYKFRFVFVDDESPQIWNIFKEDMNIVGPKSGLLRKMKQYGGYERQQLYVQPDLSYYWQIALN